MICKACGFVKLFRRIMYVFFMSFFRMRAFARGGTQVLGQPGRQNCKSLQNYIFRNLLFIVF